MAQAQLLAELEAAGARTGADAVARDLGALLDSGADADVVFRVGEGEGAEDIAAHRLVLTARSPVFAAMLAERWGGAVAAASSSSSSEARCTIAIENTAPAAFKQLLRFVYTGRCEAGALAAMPDHLLAASAAHGVDELHALSASALMLSVTVENACDYFALAHAHDNQDLMDMCAELAAKEMAAVTESEGFKRHLAERSAVGTSLMARMGQLSSPEAKGRKRKREEEGGGQQLLFTAAGANVTLSAGNKVAVKSGGSSRVNSVAVLGESLAGGVHCWELLLTAGTYVSFGVCKAGVDVANTSSLYNKSDAWSMHGKNGGLRGNGKALTDGPGGFAAGDRLGCRLDLGAGTLQFFKNGAPHGPGHTGVVGPVKRLVEMFHVGASVTLCEHAPQFQ